jgi:hypothetical protein
MSISYDGEAPGIDAALAEQAELSRMHAVQILCWEETAARERGLDVTFWAMMPFLPRVGELIILQDGKPCIVREVQWRLYNHPASGVRQLQPYVLASRPEEDGEATK